MKSIKSNISKPGKPLGLYIEEQGTIDWAELEKVEGTKSREQQAVDWIKSTLANGPVPSAEFNAMAGAAGHSSSTIDRAKKAVGTISESSGGEWSIRLARTPTKNTNGADHEK
jgi:hypothetical protein